MPATFFVAKHGFQVVWMPDQGLSGSRDAMGEESD